jgi:prepilin-type N-terminal cleavage/methylation domain-containing protein
MIIMLEKGEAENKRDKKGFTLIEVITVLLVVSLGMIGVLSLIVQNIQSQSLNKNTLVAYQLAQEGIELIRQVRDTNWREANDWDDNLHDGKYYMDYTDTIPLHSSSQSSGNLAQDADGMYISNPNGLVSGTTFSRIIVLDKKEHGILVVSNIYWTDHGRNYVYSLEAMLYDWR